MFYIFLVVTTSCMYILIPQNDSLPLFLTIKFLLDVHSILSLVILIGHIVCRICVLVATLECSSLLNSTPLTTSSEL